LGVKPRGAFIRRGPGYITQTRLHRTDRGRTRTHARTHARTQLGHTTPHPPPHPHTQRPHASFRPQPSTIRPCIKVNALTMPPPACAAWPCSGKRKLASDPPAPETNNGKEVGGLDGWLVWGCCWEMNDLYKHGSGAWVGCRQGEWIGWIRRRWVGVGEWCVCVCATRQMQ
jgi:hypothetical protein